VCARRRADRAENGEKPGFSGRFAVRGAQKPSFHEIGIKENQWVSVTSEIPTRAKMADLLAFSSPANIHATFGDTIQDTRSSDKYSL
jgi:hypothetical protein